MKRAIAALAFCGALGAAVVTRADETFLPAIVYDVGGKADKSFNEAAYRGAQRFETETGIAVREFEITNETQRAQAFANMARRGASIVVGVGFTQRAALETVARQYPAKKFTLIDATSDLPNVQSVVFREQEGSFLVGVLAALASKTHKLGFVGGMDIPLIRRFAAGYAAGARYADPAVEIFVNMTGTTPAAWQDPARGGELARSQFDRGADIVYAAAGSTGLGVLQAAADAKKLAIGVDSNQDHLHPGTMLTSMVKRVDLAVYQAFRSAKDGGWQAGIRSLGVAEDGVGFTLDEYNDALVTPTMRAKADAARADIVAGKIAVPDKLSP
ncbi:MAG TPA: BMP family ABC transporter substrate-binding protein [Stellaceae bacterium]|jgi:basic membrane protein A|nr:BMP family ABC transporter substrate-binding protein [Stellaceae bacterium]